MAQYIIQPGDTLGAIAKRNNTSVEELARLNGIADPNRIKAGSPIDLPDLSGTLPPVKEGNSASASGVGEGANPANRTLPSTSTGYLARFQNLLKLVTNRAAQEGVAKGAEALPAGMPEASQVSGSSFANLLNTVRQQKTQGVADIYKTTADLLDRQQQEADNQLQTLISTGAIANMDDAQLSRIAEATHTPLDYLKTIKQTKVSEATKKESGGYTPQDIKDYTDMVLTGQMDLLDIPVSDKLRLSVGNQLNQIYTNPVAKQVEVWKAKKQKFISEGEADKAIADPGTREDLIRNIVASQEMSADPEGIQKIKDIVYALIPDVWEFNIQRRWKPSESASGFEGTPTGK